MKKLYIETYGCQMNADDSMRMSHLLAPLQYALTQDPKEADLVIINTCSVREKASHKAHSAVGRFYPLKNSNPDLLLGIAGCQAQVEGGSLLKRFKNLDFVLGPDQVQKLPEMIAQLEDRNKRAPIAQTARIKPSDFEFVNLVPQATETLHSAYVTIMKGCDNFCSFCIVPFVRGREVSRASNEIVDEVKRLVEHGVKEVTLLGQNVNSYGTKKGEISFADLLHRIAQETGVQRIRFTTSHPKDVKEDLMRAFRDIPKLASHLHLPVQSGSNPVLEKMYRTYTREEYVKIIEETRRYCPEIAITTDFIIGFCGETDENFRETLSLVEQIRFDSAYAFQYSTRPHTTAGRYFADDIPEEAKKERLRILQEVQGRITQEKNEACVGKTSEILLEGASKWGDSYQGRTSQNRIVHLKGDLESLVGQMVSVKISRATPTALMGEVNSNG